MRKNGEDRKEISREGGDRDGVYSGYRLQHCRAAGLGGRLCCTLVSQAGSSLSLQSFIFPISLGRLDVNPSEFVEFYELLDYFCVFKYPPFGR